MSYDLAYKNTKELVEDTSPDLATALVPIILPTNDEVVKAKVTNLFGQASAIIDVTGGAVIDVEARVAINSILAVMRTNGWITP